MEELGKPNWFVAHTRPRREKKLKEYCEKEGISVTLPCYPVVHKYPRKVVVFEKPLFPGYVFLRIQPHQKRSVVQSDHVARLLFVYDQDVFARQLENILKLLNANSDVYLAPEARPGLPVRIKSGPLRGVEGSVTQRVGITTILLRIDFIGQAAAVKLEADQLELL